MNADNFLSAIKSPLNCLGIILLIILIYITLKIILSNILIQQVENIFEKAKHQTIRLSQDEVVQARQLLETANSWYDKNPQAWYYQSQLAQNTWNQQDSLKIPGSDRNAANRIEKAISLRPTWPFFYIQKAIIYSEHSHLDKHFFHAFDRAFELGRYESNSSLALLQIGIINWYRLPEDYQDKVVELAHLSLQQKSNSTFKLWQIIDQKNLGSWFCFRLPKSARKKELCSFIQRS